MNDKGSNGVASPAAVSKIAVLQWTDDLASELAHIKTLAVAFERWHEDMIYMTARTRDMNSKGEDLATIARQLIMVSMNAAIEAAHAGDVARGFVVVAAEVKSQASRVQTLAGAMGKDLHKNELMTTVTFQDIQAGGKMMMAAISGLEELLNRFRTDIGEASS